LLFINSSKYQYSPWMKPPQKSKSHKNHYCQLLWQQLYQQEEERKFSSGVGEWTTSYIVSGLISDWCVSIWITQILKNLELKNPDLKKSR
jgi:hypothetical protein